MTLALKPHCVTVRPIAQAPDPTSHVAAPPSWEAGSAVWCQITPQRPRPFRVDARTGYMLSRPHTLLCDPEDGELFHYGDRVEFGERVFACACDPLLFVTGMPNDHVEVLLEELRYAAATG